MREALGTKIQSAELPQVMMYIKSALLSPPESPVYLHHKHIILS